MSQKTIGRSSLVRDRLPAIRPRIRANRRRWSPLLWCGRLKFPFILVVFGRVAALSRSTAGTVLSARELFLELGCASAERFVDPVLDKALKWLGEVTPHPQIGHAYFLDLDCGSAQLRSRDGRGFQRQPGVGITAKILAEQQTRRPKMFFVTFTW